MKAYVVVACHRVAEPELMAAYAAVALPAIAAYDGIFLARVPGPEVTTREAGMAERTVLIQFPSRQRALEAWDSVEYQAAFDVIRDHVRRDVRFVEVKD